MPDELETPPEVSAETPKFRVLVPLERYDMNEVGLPKVDDLGKRIKLHIPAGSVEAQTSESVELVLQGQLAPDNDAARAVCVAAGVTEAVLASRIAARKKFERALHHGTFAKLEAAQQ